MQENIFKFNFSFDLKALQAKRGDEVSFIF